MCVTFVGLHKLLQKNEPLELSFGKCGEKQKELPKQKSELKPNPERVKMLTKDIDKYFISKWYNNISKDYDFTDESKLFLEEVINRLVEVQLAVNNKVLLHGILNIYLKHLKEFRRSLKRKEKYSGGIEELYRYSHICSCSSSKPKDYFIHQLTTNLLRHFINSELWNSLPCHVLISILARKLLAYMLNLTSDPEILNYILLNAIASKDVREKYKLNEYGRIHITQSHDTTNTKEKTTAETIKPEINKESEKKDADEGSKGADSLQKEKPNDKKVDTAEEPIEQIITEKRVVSDPVKIYESKSRNVRTWNDSKDLTLGISLGQDPLDIMQNTGEPGRTVGRSTFWDAVFITTNKERNILSYLETSIFYSKSGHSRWVSPTAANILLNEVRHTTQSTMEGLKSSIKPFSDATVHTLHNIKDLQESTVNNALHKIGDFQNGHCFRMRLAGMVEGILDFGRAGLRKGLRLTGLQDNIENAKATLHLAPTAGKQQPKKKTTRLTRSDSPDKSSLEDGMESVWINPSKSIRPILMDKYCCNTETCFANQVAIIRI
ncbi:hypothetical protein NQ318_011586 [Aromia moschata]|uniref:PXA domain-containing protein n=1 Tax=Aromia moschata TaxID=1265417 RepID=A0AAV8Z7U7_9CUCU|nr:hypothetical protein NQ318_011586 [Aromia moschata]